MSPERSHPEQYPEFQQYESLLRSVSSEIIPIYFHRAERRSLYQFLPPIIHDIKATSDKVMSGEVPLEEARKKVILITGVPGSGKTTIGGALHDILTLADINPDFVSSDYWDVAQGGADHGERIAQTLDSHEKMRRSNDNAYDNYKKNTNWIVKLDEKAPMVKRNRFNPNYWDGRDAGATYMERIVQDEKSLPQEQQKIDFINLNFAPEARIRYYPGPNRKSGAYPNQTALYDTFATGFALEKDSNGNYVLDLPVYLPKILEDKEWMEHGRIRRSGFPFIDLLNSFADHSVQKNVIRYTNQGRPYTEDQRLADHKWFRRWAVQMDCKAIAGLIVMNDFVQNELGIGENNIFMGMNCPPMQKFASIDYTLDDYFNAFTTADLKR